MSLQRGIGFRIPRRVIETVQHAAQTIIARPQQSIESRAILLAHDLVGITIAHGADLVGVSNRQTHQAIARPWRQTRIACGFESRHRQKFFSVIVLIRQIMDRQHTRRVFPKLVTLAFGVQPIDRRSRVRIVDVDHIRLPTEVAA